MVKDFKGKKICPITSNNKFPSNISLKIKDNYQKHNDRTSVFFFILVQLKKRGGFPGGTSGKEPTCLCRRYKRHGFNPQVWKIPWRKAWQRTLVFLPGESYGQRSLVGCSPRGGKESDTTEAAQHAHMQLKRPKYYSCSFILFGQSTSFFFPFLLILYYNPFQFFPFCNEDTEAQKLSSVQLLSCV